MRPSVYQPPRMSLIWKPPLNAATTWPRASGAICPPHAHGSPGSSVSGHEHGPQHRRVEPRDLDAATVAAVHNRPAEHLAPFGSPCDRAAGGGAHSRCLGRHRAALRRPRPWPEPATRLRKPPAQTTPIRPTGRESGISPRRPSAPSRPRSGVRSHTERDLVTQERNGGGVSGLWGGRGGARRCCCG